MKLSLPAGADALLATVRLQDMPKEDSERIADTLLAARVAGFAAGVASVWRILGSQHPAPPMVRRDLGSLDEDAYAIRRDGERLVQQPGS